MSQQASWCMVEERSVTRKYALAGLSPSGQLLAIGSDGKVIIFNAKMEKQKEVTAVHQPDSLKIHWGHNESIVFAYHESYGQVAEIVLNAGQVTGTWRPQRQSKVSCITTSPTHTFVAFGFADGVITVFRRSDQKEMQSVRVSDKPVHMIRFMDDNSFIASDNQGTIVTFIVR